MHNPNMKEIFLFPGSPAPLKTVNINRKITLRTVKSPRPSKISNSFPDCIVFSYNRAASTGCQEFRDTSNSLSYAAIELNTKNHA